MKKRKKIFVSELELSSRICSLLITNQIFFISDLIQKTPEELKQIRGLGPKSLEEIRNALQEISADDYEILSEESRPEILQVKHVLASKAIFHPKSEITFKSEAGAPADNLSLSDLNLSAGLSKKLAELGISDLQSLAELSYEDLAGSIRPQTAAYKELTGIFDKYVCADNSPESSVQDEDEQVLNTKITDTERQNAEPDRTEEPAAENTELQYSNPVLTSEPDSESGKESLLKLEIWKQAYQSPDTAEELEHADSVDEQLPLETEPEMQESVTDIFPYVSSVMLLALPAPAPVSKHQSPEDNRSPDLAYIRKLEKVYEDYLEEQTQTEVLYQKKHYEHNRLEKSIRQYQTYLEKHEKSAVEELAEKEHQVRLLKRSQRKSKEKSLVSFLAFWRKKELDLQDKQAVTSADLQERLKREEASLSRLRQQIQANRIANVMKEYENHQVLSASRADLEAIQNRKEIIDEAVSKTKYALRKAQGIFK